MHILKKTASLLLLAAGIVLFSACSSPVEYHRFTFQYKQLPLQPLDDRIETYSPQVVIGYVDHVKEMEAAYAKEVERAQERYNKDLEAYNSQSTVGKIINKELLNQEKPVYTPPLRPFIPEIPNTDELESRYVYLDGYKKGTVNPVLITVTVNRLIIDPPTMSTKTKTKTVEGQKVTESYDVYSVTYSQPIHLYMESGLSGDVIYDRIVPGTEKEYSKSYTGSLPADYQETIEESALHYNMKLVNAFLNDNYAFRKQSLTTDLAYAEHKKHDYSDYREALEHALSGFNMLYSDEESANKKLQAAIDIWENALRSFRPGNKKARINNEIGVETMLNIAQASVFTGDYVKAEQFLTKAEVNEPTKNQKSRILFWRRFMKDFQARENANG